MKRSEGYHGRSLLTAPLIATSLQRSVALRCSDEEGSAGIVNVNTATESYLTSKNAVSLLRCARNDAKGEEGL